MSVFKVLKRYKLKLEKRLTSQTSRKQLNFACDEKIIIGLKVLSRDLEVPIYPLCEHLLQLGMSEVAVTMENEALKEELCRHLLQHHLLVPTTELEPPSDGALRAKSVIDLLQIIESWSGSHEALAKLLAPIIREAASMDILEKQRNRN